MKHKDCCSNNDYLKDNNHHHHHNCNCHHDDHQDNNHHHHHHCNYHHDDHQDNNLHHHHEDGCNCHHHHGKNKKKHQLILMIRVIFSLIILVVSFFINQELIKSIFLVVSYIIIAYDIIFYAFKNLFKGKLMDENFLMTIASLTALIVHFINKDVNIDAFDGVLVILLYQVGEFFQHLAVDKSKDSISKMMDLDIDNVIKIIDNNEEIIDINDIKVDDILLIKPGKKIPVDGIIVEGSSSLNTASITGESKPIEVYKNDKVVSGCINNDGVLKIKAISTTKNSTTAKVKKIIDEASKNKSSSEKFITKFAKIYTPIVILLSLCVIFIIPLILGFKENFITYLYKGLSIMVISCPCALVLSIPLSFFIGIGKCAKEGILVKGSNYLESLSLVDLIAFDKTGTLTKGTFNVNKIESNNKELMETLLYSCEKNFLHPISVSISNYLMNKVKEVKIENLINIPGYGIKGSYENKEILIGNYKFLKEHNIEVPSIHECGTIVYVSYDNAYLGYVLITDCIKEDADETLKKLNKKYQIYLISGDNKEVVLKVANELNIKNVYYETLPEDKLNIINKLKEKNRVAYVGDGINDVACLLASSCGIAMKSLSDDITLSASDIVIMDDKVFNIVKAIKISNKTMKIVKQNIIFSISIKILVMVLAMIINIPMFVAIIADVGVCLLAICNSLRIMYRKHKF